MEQPEILDSPQTSAEPQPEEQHDPDQAVVEALQAESEQQAETEDEVEDEVDGVKVRGKKDLIEKLRNERLMQAAFTQKTQALAAERKAVQEQAAIQQQFVEEVAAVKSIDSQIEQFKAIDWEKLTEADPVQAMRLDRQMRNLQDQRSQIASAIAAKVEQRNLQEQTERSRRLQEGQATLAREIKGWGPEKATAVTQFAIEYGFPKEALSNIDNPMVVKLLHDAYTLAQLRKNAGASAKKPEPQAAPVSRINATKAVANRDPDKMNTADWLKWRESQLRRK